MVLLLRVSMAVVEVVAALVEAVVDQHLTALSAVAVVEAVVATFSLVVISKTLLVAHRPSQHQVTVQTHCGALLVKAVAVRPARRARPLVPTVLW